ncbi:MAG TPA: hypothetical protein PKD79_01545 [Candidatus Doudnabacteria bacterium]|nr:hypothetical protein [Candidatus Doudnabacteria bacterium]
MFRQKPKHWIAVSQAKGKPLQARSWTDNNFLLPIFNLFSTQITFIYNHMFEVYNAASNYNHIKFQQWINSNIRKNIILVLGDVENTKTPPRMGGVYCEYLSFSGVITLPIQLYPNLETCQDGGADGNRTRKYSLVR